MPEAATRPVTRALERRYQKAQLNRAFPSLYKQLFHLRRDFAFQMEIYF